MYLKQLYLTVTFFVSLCFCETKLLAQTPYKAAVGARFGYGFGLAGNYMFDQRNGHGLEFLLRYGYHGLILNKPGVHIQVLYEKHWAIKRSNWTGYVGVGPGIGFGKKNSLAKQTYFALGISPIVGVDYTTQQLRIPIIIALDYKPTLHGDFPIGNGAEKPRSNFSYYEIAFSVKVGLGK